MSLQPFWIYMKKVLPEIDLFDNKNQNILESDKDPETKVIKIVSNFLKHKKERNLNVARHNALLAEAKDINKLFPSLTVDDIYNQLDIFRDMPNRKEIVLRLIVHSKTSKNAPSIGNKRMISDPELFDNLNNNYSGPKVRKLSVPPATATYEFIPSSTVTTQALNPTVEWNTLECQNAVSVIQPPKFDYFKSSKSATVTSTVTSSSAQEITKPNGSENYNFMNVDYEIPDITEHFDVNLPTSKIVELPEMSLSENEVTDVELPVARNFVVNFDGESMSSISLDQVLVEKPIENITDDANNLCADPEVSYPDLELPYCLQANNGLTQYIKEETDTFHWNEITDVKPLGETKYDTNTVDTECSEASKVRVRRLSDLMRPTQREKKQRQYLDMIEQTVASPLSITSSDESHQKGTDSYTSSCDTRDSNQTEINSPDLEILEVNGVPLGRNYTVSMLNPTTIKISEQKEDANKAADLGLNLTIKDKNPIQDDNALFNSKVKSGPLQSIPSTSKEEKMEEMGTNGGDFNLVEYLRELTNASTEVIKKQCNKLRLPLKIKPPPHMLNALLDKIFEGSYSNSEDEYDDMDEDIITLDESQDNGSTTTSVPLKSEESQNEKPAENPNTNLTLDMQLVNSLCSIFPEACPKYVKGLCKGKSMSAEIFDELITVILNADNKYPKRPKPAPEPEVLPENQLEILQEFLPDADPDYLRMMCDKFEGKPDLVKTFLNEAMERREYPKMKDYQRRQQLSAQQKQYTTEFSVENFTKVIHDPHAFFSDPSRNIKLDAASSHYALIFLRNKFNRLPVRTIQSAFTKNQTKLSQTFEDLKRASTQSSAVMKSIRKPVEMPKNIENIPLLQEIAYYSHETEINEYLKKMKEKEEAERQEAKSKGLMKTCNCCYDEEVLPKDTFTCENGCEFCKSCVLKSSEVRFGEGKLDFPCLMNCDYFFSLQTLQAVLPPKLFSKVAQKKTLEEVKSAGIEELEYCPFCDFATIPAEGYTIFTCMNPECMKESCRMCKEPSHIPLRCDEIEKDEDVRARTFVENKMTEALLRNCYKCGVKFFKEEGCNKMTCSCGAQMCYVCGQPVTSYKHFNGNGGDRFDLCPLYSDTNVLNKENVLKGAEAAKAEIGNMNLKHDPTLDVDKHYKERSKKFPQGHLLMGQRMQGMPDIRIRMDLGNVGQVQPPNFAFVAPAVRLAQAIGVRHHFGHPHNQH